MPKIVDREHRREEICGAAMRILARGGPNALTLRSLAADLNGSITLVTHFFANRDDLFAAITDDLLASFDDEDEWIVPGDPVGSLRGLLGWLVPSDSVEVEREASRVSLASMRDQSPGIDHFFVAMEQRIRAMLTESVSAVVEPAFVPTAVDTLRATVNGLVLSIVEHPEYWTTKRRSDVLDVIHSAVCALGSRSLAASS